MVGIQHHGVIFGLGQLCQQFGMAGIKVARRVQRLFVQRGGGNRLHVARQRQFGGALHAAPGQIAGLLLYLARLQRVRIGQRLIDDVNDARCEMRILHAVQHAQLGLRRNVQRQHPTQRRGTADHHRRNARQLPFCQRFNDDFRADARRIAHGHRNSVIHSTSPQ